MGSTDPGRSDRGVSVTEGAFKDPTYKDPLKDPLRDPSSSDPYGASASPYSEPEVREGGGSAKDLVEGWLKNGRRKHSTEMGYLKWITSGWTSIENNSSPTVSVKPPPADALTLVLHSPSFRSTTRGTTGSLATWTCSTRGCRWCGTPSSTSPTPGGRVAPGR